MTGTDGPTRGVPQEESAPKDHERERLYRDVARLVEFDRRTATVGEHRSAQYIAGELVALGAADVATPTFRTQSSWAPAHLAHVAITAAAAAFPHRTARMVAALTAISYELEVSGRSQWVRRLIPARRGTSVTARIPAGGRSYRTLILVAHHDAAHNGWVWQRSAVAASQWLSRRTGRAVPSHVPALSAMVAAAVPGRVPRLVAAGVLAGSAALMAQSMRSRTTPGANDNASGVAAVLELARRLIADPLPGTTVLVVLPGGEEVGNTGIRQWLRHNRPQLDPETTLAINLDAVGSHGPLAVAYRESLSNPLSRQAVRRARECAAELGIDIRTRAIPNPTDAVGLTHAGLTTVSLLSDEDGWISHLHRSSDTIDQVDWRTVGHAVTLSHHIAAAWAAEGDRR
ncbi:M28 family peptidase [Tsukamurella sp. 8F]|uniref:M28 family peptidase n=1 Tax=unclassified Tsukamurella TaxID=2633480 RepID=UPI0023B903EF|nr:MULTISPECIES: M28 family peptidase [unclassified Tsukamurella]MDF0528385.1 M28 family peptidase [Tsukamurella sp. 8J]MDF0586210.1 M28 family peptidase [Tsukamurella sp. 8F]